MIPAFIGQAFGLTFRCNRLLPELAAWSGAASVRADVDIEWSGAARAGPLQTPFSDGLFRASRDTVELRIPGIANYRVTAARVEIVPEPGIDDASVRAFLFGSAVGALLHLRETVVLHGSAVRMPDGRSAVFCGHSTTGKSTLAMALARRRHTLLADDTTALRIDAQGQAWCLPGLAKAKLWRHALSYLGLADQAHSADRVRPNLDKYSLSLVAARDPTPLGRVYELRALEQGALAISEITGVGRVNLLMTHTYRPRFLKAMGRQPQHMRRIAALAPLVRMARIDRPLHEPTLDAICDRLEEEWGP